VALFAGKAATLDASVDLSGSSGGDLLVEAGGDVRLGNVIDVRAAGTDFGGVVDVRAGTVDDGTLTVTRNVLASAPGAIASHPVHLAGCHLVVNEDVKVDASGVHPNDPLAIRLISYHPMQLRAGSRFIATPSGAIETIHPPGAAPVLGPRVVFDPPRIDVLSPVLPNLGCGLL
jgi:hypothetical protein